MRALSGHDPVREIAGEVSSSVVRLRLLNIATHKPRKPERPNTSMIGSVLANIIALARSA
jgi:hypothetical protein